MPSHVGPDNNLIAERHMGPSGAFLGSKSAYIQAYPDHLVVFNAGLVVDGDEVWFGDLDVTRKHTALVSLAAVLEQIVEVYYEMDRLGLREGRPSPRETPVRFLPNGQIQTDGRASLEGRNPDGSIHLLRPGRA